MSIALVTQNAKRMRHIIYPPVDWLSLQYFSSLFHKRHDFMEESQNTKRRFYFLFLSDFNENW
jgi:hypothetical protein